MTIENNKKYKLTGEQIKDLASRFGVLSGEIGDLANLTTTDKTNLVAAINEAAGGGSGPTVVQTTGTSTTDVMSQNATTSMVFADPGSGTGYNQKVRMGDGATVSGGRGVAIGAYSSGSGYRSVALGDSATATGRSSVALAYSSANSKGEFAIGVSGTEGYNSSAYRLISGVYDGQNAHDAATKGQLDSIAIQNAGAPTTATVGTVGQLLEDTTNGKLYICTAVSGNTYTWVEVGAGGGGSGITELTSADYDYPTDNPINIALWNLQPGVYTSAYGVYVKPTAATTAIGSGSIVLVSATQDNSRKSVYVFDGSYNDIHYVTTSDGSLVDAEWLIGTKDLAQTSGNSQTQAMSQNAVTSMVFADPSTSTHVYINGSGQTGSGKTVAIHGTASGANSVAIGSSSNALSTRAIAIGDRTTANAEGAIALGSGASTGTKGVFAIGDDSGYGRGYNSSAYRLLTGLYDPQSAHDAATKGYVDPTTDSSAPTTATVGRLGQIQIDTTTATAYMCVAVDTVTPAYTWKQITA